jgi:hypothetical protein
MRLLSNAQELLLSRLRVWIDGADSIQVVPPYFMELRSLSEGPRRTIGAYTGLGVTPNIFPFIRQMTVAAHSAAYLHLGRRLACSGKAQQTGRTCN